MTNEERNERRAVLKIAILVVFVDVLSWLFSPVYGPQILASFLLAIVAWQLPKLRLVKTLLLKKMQEDEVHDLPVILVMPFVAYGWTVGTLGHENAITLILGVGMAVTFYAWILTKMGVFDNSRPLNKPTDDRGDGVG